MRPLHNHPTTLHQDLLVGLSSGDDAGVLRLPDGRLMVQTVDYFTPVVDDPGDWGRIAAANALSDIYAMGGTPSTALQLIGWPRGKLSFELLGEVISGGVEKLEEGTPEVRMPMILAWTPTCSASAALRQTIGTRWEPLMAATICTGSQGRTA